MMYLLFFLPCSVIPAAGQSNLETTGWFWRIGGTFRLGLPVNRVGLVFSGGYEGAGWESTLEWRGFFNTSGYGPKVKGFEQQLSLGTHLGFGPPKQSNDRFFAPNYAYLDRHYAFGYILRWYLDQIQTSQWTGAFAMKFGQFRMALENDAMVPGKPRDCFRTGAWSMAYTTGIHTWEIRNILWHGQTRCSDAKVERHTDYPCRYGYRLFQDCTYGNYSHGILSFNIHRQLPLGQTLGLGLGLDAEQIRNLFQNWLIHDLWIIPEKWNKARNPHYLMLDENGKPYLALPEQNIRPVRAVFQFGWNNEPTY